MSDPAFIASLNEDLAKEYAAAVQYYQHAATITGLHAAFISELQAHAQEEIGHAIKLSNHIAYLGGVPIAAMAQAYTASSPEAMLKQDLNSENDAISRYKERITQARSAGDYGTEAILLDILEDEEHHANDLETFLAVQK